MNDDTLTLFYYDDGLTNHERREVINALAADPSLAERYRSLCRKLEQFSDPETPKPRSDMVQRWHASLDRVAGFEQQTKPDRAVHSWSFFLGAAISAALAVGIGIGFFIADEERPITPIMEELIVDKSGGTRGSSAFIRGLQVHLRESERGLTSMPVDSDTDRALLLMNIIEQNQLFKRAAEQNDSENLARVLRAFNLVLVQLAADDISQAEAEALRAKLLFELNVVLTKLARDTSDEPQTI